jgi:hypothetical protein
MNSSDLSNIVYISIYEAPSLTVFHIMGRFQKMTFRNYPKSSAEFDNEMLKETATALQIRTYLLLWYVEFV